MANLTKVEGVAILKEAKAKMAAATNKEEALAILKKAGSEVGYSPAMRCLVAGVEPDKAIRWN